MKVEVPHTPVYVYTDLGAIERIINNLALQRHQVYAGRERDRPGARCLPTVRFTLGAPSDPGAER